MFTLYASQLVLREAQAGDHDKARRRLKALGEVELLEVTEDALALAEDLVSKGPLPRKAAEDAVHIAVAVVNGLDYLITWNCKHIANARMRDKIEQSAAPKVMNRSSSVRLNNCWRSDAMWEDPIVEEVRKARDAHAAQFDYDLRDIYRALK